MPGAKRTWNTIAIIGVGLIGGSIGMAVRQRKLAKKIIGIGRRQASLDRAIQCGAIDAASTDIARGVAEAELIIVCTPVNQIVAHVREAAAACPAGALITDAGSTKQAIVEALDGSLLPSGVRFIGSHPLAGSEKTGCENGDADLFEGRVCVVTRTRESHADDLDAISDFWQSLGMTVVRMLPEYHDTALAQTSHLPHVVAAALASSTREDYLPLVASGWLDTTRIAAADERLWRQILLDNRENTLAAIEEFQLELNRLREAISASKGAELERLLKQGKDRRSSRGGSPDRREKKP